MLDTEGTWRAAGHGAIGAVLLGNVLLNYWLCVTTSPGYTTDLTAAVSRATAPLPESLPVFRRSTQCRRDHSPQTGPRVATITSTSIAAARSGINVLTYATASLALNALADVQDFEAAPPAPRFCDTCNCPKPALAHHCHICDKCVLRMDHHCPVRTFRQLTSLPSGVSPAEHWHLFCCAIVLLVVTRAGDEHNTALVVSPRASSAAVDGKLRGARQLPSFLPHDHVPVAGQQLLGAPPAAHSRPPGRINWSDDVHAPSRGPTLHVRLCLQAIRAPQGMMTLDQLKTAHARQASEPAPLVFAMVLSISIGTALTLLVAWHAYLIFTAQVVPLIPTTCSLPSRAWRGSTAWARVCDTMCCTVDALLRFQYDTCNLSDALQQ